LTSIIYETGIEAATNADILSGTRLNTVPYIGTLTFDVICQLNDATNSFAVTIQLPNGDVPVDSQRVPGVNPALAGVLDERMLLRLTFPTGPTGGHFNISLTETGTAVCTWRAVLRP